MEEKNKDTALKIQVNKKLDISLLYVEGDASLRKIYTKILKQHIANVYVAADGLTGLNLFRKHKPDIVLTDVRLKVISGLEMISMIRKEDKDIRIIIMSAFSESNYFLSAISFGVKGYLLKPVETDTLIKLIDEQAYSILLDKKVKEEENKRREAEKSKEKGEAILQVLAYASTTFFREGFTNGSVNKVLKEIGESTNASRVYIFQNFKDNKGKPYISQIYEWVKETVHAEIDNQELVKIYFDEPVVKRWVDILSKRGYISGLVADLPDGAEKELLKSQDIVSILAVPIFMENEWWGFVGLDDCFEKRVWSHSEIKAMETLAGNLGAAIYRKEVELELLQLNAHLEQRVAERTKELEMEAYNRKQTQIRLKESEEKYRLIYENANNGIILVIEGKIIMINPEIVNIFNIMPRKMTGKPLKNFILKEDQPVLDAYFKKIHEQEEPVSIDVRIQSGSGTFKWLDIKTNEIIWVDEPAYLVFVSDITSRKMAEQEIKLLNKTLESRIEAEIQKVKQQQQLLMQKSKLESMGELSAGLSHEINQPLGGISMGLENILMHLDSEEHTDKEYVKKKFVYLFRDIDRIKNIIQHVRTFSRDQQKIIMEKVNINDVIIAALSLMEVQLKNHNIILKKNFPDESVYVEGNRYRIEQVILNLLSNAQHAVEEKERRLKSSDYIKKVEVSCNFNKKYCMIWVQDNGIGIPEENVNNIFDPFFTTKDEEKGTGLGLSISYGIINEMKGEIDLETEEGLFTRFKIKLPLLKKSI